MGVHLSQFHPRQACPNRALAAVTSYAASGTLRGVVTAALVALVAASVIVPLVRVCVRVRVRVCACVWSGQTAANKTCRIASSSAAATQASQTSQAVGLHPHLPESPAQFSSFASNRLFPSLQVECSSAKSCDASTGSPSTDPDASSVPPGSPTSPGGLLPPGALGPSEAPGPPEAPAGHALWWSLEPGPRCAHPGYSADMLALVFVLILSQLQVRVAGPRAVGIPRVTHCHV